MCMVMQVWIQLVISPVCVVSRILTLPVHCGKRQNLKAMRPQSLLKTNMGFIWGFSRQCLYLKSLVKWCQITLRHELINISTVCPLCAHYSISACRKTAVSMSWQQDGCLMPVHLPWAASKWVSAPFGSAGPDRLKEARRVSKLIHGTCRERQRCFLDRTVLLANCFTKISESQADLATVSLSGHMRIFERVLKANNRWDAVRSDRIQLLIGHPTS